jgi:DNA ligase (NAD+)
MWRVSRASRRLCRALHASQGIRAAGLTLLPDDVRTRMVALRVAIAGHNAAYYAGRPTVSDAEFDAQFAELRVLEQLYAVTDAQSPTQQVGTGPADLHAPGNKVAHAIPMLSLNNAFTLTELRAFHQSLVRQLAKQGDTCLVTLVAELKFDGMAASFIYEDGELVQVLSRGDGACGHNLLAAVRLMTDASQLPRQLPPSHQWARGRVTVRGEVVLPTAEFHRLNARANSDGTRSTTSTSVAPPRYHTPRNLCAGLLQSEAETLAGYTAEDLPRMHVFAYGAHDSTDAAPRM